MPQGTLAAGDGGELAAADGSQLPGQRRLPAECRNAAAAGGWEGGLKKTEGGKLDAEAGEVDGRGEIMYYKILNMVKQLAKTTVEKRQPLCHSYVGASPGQSNLLLAKLGGGAQVRISSLLRAKQSHFCRW